MTTKTTPAPKQQITASIDPELAAWLKEEAERRAVGTAYLLERALRALRTALPPLPDVGEG